MKIQQNTMAIIISFLCVADAYAMLHSVRRMSKCQIGGKQVKRISVVTAKTHFDFRQQIEKVGLDNCRRVFEERNGHKEIECQNALCCKDAYPLNDNLTDQQEAQCTRNYFLQQVDKSETGRVQAALQIKQAYKKLRAIEKEMQRSGLQEVDIEALKNVINHQKKCLSNQFRVIAEASPVVEEKSQYTLGFSKSGDLKIKKMRVLVVPQINERDKE